ncbi:sensor histidine kinase [Flavobacterium sp. 3HN19-14]|uniref:sensor histidine kinase n=1 Tax=Flavobacterium sp. 3HN19-14 TaxID=3448133 RepID=UPI003EE2C540
MPVYVSFTDLHPNVAAIGVVVTDLSEKRKHEQALIQYQQQLEAKVNELNLTNTNLEQFIHVISHDLKEPIRKIVSYTSFLKDNKTNSFAEQELNQLNIIKSSALRLNALVDDLVKYAFNATKSETEELDLDVIFNEVLEDHELMISESNSKITSEHLPKIMGSKVQIRQIFSNLITNSIKYRKADTAPVINILASVTDQIDVNAPMRKFHKISLSDNGIGMNNSDLTKIFTIFQRLHMRNEYSGNGIGLAICKKIMENHDGKIDVESETGKGSTFNLYFPVIE